MSASAAVDRTLLVLLAIGLLLSALPLPTDEELHAIAVKLHCRLNPPPTWHEPKCSVRLVIREWWRGRA